MAILLELMSLSYIKHLDFPLTSKIDEDGVRNFTHNMGNELIYIYIYIYISMEQD